MNVRRKRRAAPRPEPIRVVARRSGAVTPPPKRRLRRYEAAVPMAVPATRRAAPWRLTLPRIRFRRAHWALLAVLVLALTVVLAFTLPVFRLTDVQVEGLTRVPAAEVAASLGVQGRPVWLVRPAQLETALLETYPEFAAVRVRRQFWPVQVTIAVTERQPVAAIRQDGRLFLVDAEGVIILPRQDAPALPTVTAFAPLVDESTGRISPALAEAVAVLGAVIPADARLLYEPRYGLGWQTASGQRVFVGREPQQLTLQMQLYERLMEVLAAQGVQPTLVDLGNLRAPYFKAGY